MSAWRYSGKLLVCFWGGGSMLINLAHARGIFVAKLVLPAVLSVIFSLMLAGLMGSMP